VRKGASHVKITADRDVCIGSGNCVVTAPRVFDQDDADAVRDAVAHCPSGALKIVEDS